MEKPKNQHWLSFEKPLQHQSEALFLEALWNSGWNVASQSHFTDLSLERLETSFPIKGLDNSPENNSNVKTNPLSNLTEDKGRTVSSRFLHFKFKAHWYIEKGDSVA